MKKTRNLVIIVGVLTVLFVIVSVFNIRVLNKERVAGSNSVALQLPPELEPSSVEKQIEDLRKNKKELSPEQKNSLAPLISKTSPLPYRSEALDISYSPTLETFFIHKKSPLADSKLRTELSPQLYQLYQENESYKLFVVGTHNVDYTQFAYEAAKNRLDVKGAVYAQDQAPNANPAEGDVPTEEDYTNMMDLFKIGTTLMGGGPEDSTGGAAGGGGAANINLDNADPQFDANSEVVQRCIANKQVYVDAEKITSVPWYVLAGIHYREGTCHNTVSLRSGRGLGDTEPDVNEGCTNNSPGQGKPVPSVNGGCTFMTLLDSAIDTGNLLKGKANDLGTGKDLSDIATLIGALSYYNGGGNRNCGAGRDDVPYGGCPRLYIGEDDPYVMNLYDKKHALMYIIYCTDGEKCPPELDGRPGVLTMAAMVKRKG